MSDIHKESEMNPNLIVSIVVGVVIGMVVGLALVGVWVSRLTRSFYGGGHRLINHYFTSKQKFYESLAEPMEQEERDTVGFGRMRTSILN